MKAKILLGVFGVGVLVTLSGWAMTNHDPTVYGATASTAAKWVIGTGLTLIVLPVLIAAGWIAAEVLKFSADEAARYKAWKASLSPDQRAYVEAAELVAAAAATAATVHHQWEKVRRFHAESQAGLAAGFAHADQLLADQRAAHQAEADRHALAQQIAAALRHQRVR